MKALFVQIDEKKSGLKVTAWAQDFSYEESAHHVYLYKDVYKNGSRSTVPAFARATIQEIPYILSVNTYFWHPSSSASGRRSNEEKRNAEIADFMKENQKEAEDYLNNLFADVLVEGEKIKVDERGAFLAYGNKTCHFNGIINKRALEEVRKLINQ